MDAEQQSLLDELAIFCSPARTLVHRAMFHDLRPDERFDAYEQAIELLLARLKQTDIALQSLTPGGSEYVANPDRCVEVAKQKLENYRRLWQEERDKRIDLERRMQNMVEVNP